MISFTTYSSRPKLSYLLLLVLTLTTACSSHSLEDFREEGEGLTRSLIQEFQTIKSREDLIRSCPRLQKLFNKLAIVMIEAAEFHEKHPDIESLGFSKENHELSDQLRVELNRVYHLDGGREIVEKCQEPALRKLDAFKKRSLKKNISSSVVPVKKVNRE